jgi:hypothetical protein
VAQHRVVQVVDDLTGAEGARTHRLRWDDHEVEIDLTEKNAADLEEVLAPYLAAGRPVATDPTGRTPSRAGHAFSGTRSAGGGRGPSGTGLVSMGIR